MRNTPRSSSFHFIPPILYPRGGNEKKSCDKRPTPQNGPVTKTPSPVNTKVRVLSACRDAAKQHREKKIGGLETLVS